MSWYLDSQLFIYEFSSVYRVTKEFRITLVMPSDLKEGEDLSFSKHLSLGNNKESNFDAFKASFSQPDGVYKFVNSQGLVINWDFDKSIGTWSSEKPNSPFWSLPGIDHTPEMLQQAQIRALQAKERVLQAEKRALEKENSDLKAGWANLERIRKEYSDLKAERDNLERIGKENPELEAEMANLERIRKELLSKIKWK